MGQLLNMGTVARYSSGMIAQTIQLALAPVFVLVAIGNLLNLLGLSAEVGILTAIYRIMPVGKVRLRHALFGGCTATLIWEGIRQVLVWFFTSLSKASLVYGPLATAVVAMFSMEIAATLLLFGAQVIAEYERLGRD